MAIANYFFYSFVTMLKKFFVFFLIGVPLFTFAQTASDSTLTVHRVEKAGKLLYEYYRCHAADDCDTCSERMVKFVFKNGDQARAISYRQETLDTQVRWIDIAGGTAGHDVAVEFVTANLRPHQTVEWTYAVSAKNGCVLQLEKAAVLVMNEKYEVEKLWLE